MPALLPNEVQISDINGLRYLKLTEDTNWYEFDQKTLNKEMDAEGPEQKAREKRWITAAATVLGTLFSVGFKGIDTYMKYKHSKAMGDALKDLYTHQVTLTEEVNALHNHSIYMAQRVYNELDQVNLRLTKHDGLFRSLNESMYEIVQAVRTNQYVNLRIYQMMVALNQLTA